MATSSITKEFVIKDENAYIKLIKDINNKSQDAIEQKLNNKHSEQENET